MSEWNWDEICHVSITIAYTSSNTYFLYTTWPLNNGVKKYFKTLKRRLYLNSFMLKLFQIRYIQIFKTFCHILRTRQLIPRTPGAYLKSYENPVPCKHTHILMKHFKLYPRCWFIHKYRKYFSKDSWKISLVLTYRQISKLLQWVSTVRSTLHGFSHALSTNQVLSS